MNWPFPVPAVPHCGDVCARGRELLDPVVAGVGDVDVVRGIRGDALRAGELAVAGARASPLAGVCARRGELLDPVVGGVGDVDVARGIRGDALRAVELAVPGARDRHSKNGDGGSPLGDERARGVELLNPVASRVGHVRRPEVAVATLVGRVNWPLPVPTAPHVQVERDRRRCRPGWRQQKVDTSTRGASSPRTVVRSRVPAAPEAFGAPPIAVLGQNDLTTTAPSLSAVAYCFGVGALGITQASLRRPGRRAWRLARGACGHRRAARHRPWPA